MLSAALTFQIKQFGITETFIWYLYVPDIVYMHWYTDVLHACVCSVF